MNHIERAKKLTPRQREIIQHAALGRQNKHIARHMHISINTVKQHRNQAYKTLGVENMYSAISIGLFAGVLDTHKIFNFYKGET